jgi:hypothetical protein
MEQFLNILFIISFEYILVKTAYKYKLPEIYEANRWKLEKDSFLDKVLPEYFCLQCFLVQSSLITSSIIVLLQQLPLSHIITYGIISSAVTLWMELNEK